MRSELKLDVDQAGELKAAFRREGPWTNEKIKMLCEQKGLLTQVLEVLDGHAEIRPVDYFVDFEIKPNIPTGLSLLPDNRQLPNRIKGQWKFDSTKLNLHLDDSQKDDKKIEGHKLRKKLKLMPVFGAQLGDFYLKNPHLISEGWIGSTILFWGSLYKDEDGDQFVSGLNFGNSGWNLYYYNLNFSWHMNCPALVLGN